MSADERLYSAWRGAFAQELTRRAFRRANVEIERPKGTDGPDGRDPLLVSPGSQSSAKSARFLAVPAEGYHVGVSGGGVENRQIRPPRARRRRLEGHADVAEGASCEGGAACRGPGEVAGVCAGDGH